MPNPEIYTNELQRFSGKYNLEEYDLSKLMDVEDKIRRIDDILTEYPTGRTPAERFIYFAEKTLSIYLGKATSFNPKGKYLSSFNAQEFLTDFEKLFDAQYRSELKEGQVPNRKKYAGADPKTINNAFFAKLHSVNKPLPTLWKERLKKKTVSLDNLREITDNAYNTLMVSMDNKEQMDGHLTNMVAAYEAIKQLRDSRNTFFGWFWKLFNREENQQEEEYFNELTSKCNNLKILKYNVDGKQADLTGKTIFGQDVKNEEKAKEAAKPKAKPVKIEPVTGRLTRKMDRNFLKNLVTEWTGKLPDNSNLTQITLEFAIGKSLLQGVKTLNEAFDAGIAKGNDPKKEMERVVKGVFKLAVSLSDTHIKANALEDKANAIKVITQETINACTAAALYPNELGDVVENCINKNVYQYKVTEREGKDFLKEIDKYEAVDTTREQVFNKGDLFTENSVNKAPQISEQPKLDVPTINRNH